jgi:hypothetical protein
MQFFALPRNPVANRRIFAFDGMWVCCECVQLS